MDPSIRPEDLLRHGDILRSLARGILGDDHRAEDVVQSAYVRALERPPRDREALGAWLGRVVRNLAVSGLRRDRRRLARERVAAAEETDPRPGQANAELAVQRQVLDAVLGLQDPFKTVIHLRYYRGLSAKQIADRLDVPLKTIESRLTRAHAQLRERLDVQKSARRLANFLTASVELMKLLARACGHERLADFSTDDLTTWKRDMAYLTGVRYGGVVPVESPGEGR